MSENDQPDVKISEPKDTISDQNMADTSGPTDEERYIASMVLSGVGDALGYKNGDWEFCHSGAAIHEELARLGGVDKLHVKLPKWMVSDDTVMSLATGEALVQHGNNPDKEVLYSVIAREYKKSMKDMAGRAPGPTCMNGCHDLKPDRKKGYQIEFNPRGGGCGAAMRAMCIGLRYPRADQLDDLIAVCVESGRMTHHHPTGYLGALAAALFTAYAFQKKPLHTWGAGLLEILPRALEYVKGRKGQYVQENIKAWGYFTEKWEAFLELRNVRDGNSLPVFPEKYGVKERDAFYKSLSFSGWGGSSGHDAPMIAYDALLSSPDLDWRELCSRSMFHSGDSDSTAVIAGSCYGAMKGFEGIAPCNHKNVEYRSRLENVARKLYALSHGIEQTSSTGAMSQGGEEMAESSHEMSSLDLPAVPPLSASVEDFTKVFGDDAKGAEQQQTVEGLEDRLIVLTGEK